MVMEKINLIFTYIEDLVRGISYCCDSEKAKNQVFNITFGGARKINDLINILRSVFPKIKIIYKEREKFMPEKRDF